MTELMISMETLRNLIGIHLDYNNNACQVIEVLEDGPSLILQRLEDDHASIQTNQYGNAHRRTPETYCIPVLSADKKELNSLFLDLGLIQ